MKFKASDFLLNTINPTQSNIDEKSWCSQNYWWSLKNSWCTYICFEILGEKNKSCFPNKEKNGTRYYDNSQIILIKTLKNLLYNQKYSIEGANKKLSKEIIYVNEKEKIINDLKELKSEIEKLI